MKKIANKQILLFLITLLAIIIFIVFILILMWNYHNVQNKKILDEISDAVTIVENEKNNAVEGQIVSENSNIEYNFNFETLREKNSDIVGWIKVNGINIDYPVVQSKNNSYYMTHNFEKNYNAAGWIFVDYKNKLDGTDKNIVIYGHNRRDGSMFSSLKNVLKKDWYTNEENKIVNFITEEKNYKYEVFSIYQVEEEDYYIQTKFNDTAFKKFINTLKKRSIYNFNTEVNENDSILTLSTCANNNQYRIVLHAKRL